METIHKSVFINIGKKMLSTENNDLKIKYKNIILEGILEFKKKKLLEEIEKLDTEIIYLLNKNNNLLNKNNKNKFILDQYKLNELTLNSLKSLRENYYLNNINI